jgi:P pilus assembly chaperone PapD
MITAISRQFGRIVFIVFVWTCVSSSVIFASISATPKFIFLDNTRKSTPIQISNQESEEREVYVEVKFGYVTSDDSGRATLYMDSTATDAYSAVPWIQIFPKRFVFGPGETQTVRLTTTPPPGIKDGEYWARILITSKPRKPTTAPKTQQKTAGGMVLQTQIGLPFHYRHGKVSTGLEISNLAATAAGGDLSVNFNLKRTGNASFWGTRTIRILDPGGKQLFTSSKNAVVYNSFMVMEHFAVQNLSPGTYRVEVEATTGKRNDIRKDDLIQSPPVRSAVSLVVQ